MTAPIAARLSIERRYVRSVDIPRDLADPEALDGYVLTPSARDAAIRVLNALAPTSRQRAFRLVGAYGSGKSAFGLFLARLLGERGRGPATRLFAAAFPDLPTPPHWESIVLMGRRVSFARELLRALSESPPALSVADTLRQRACLLHLQDSTPDPLEVTALLLDVADDVRARTGAGLLLVVDEMGRFLEHAAAHSSVEDPSVFQSLAERSGGISGANLAVLGILHHGFADYVAGLGAWIEAEWARFSDRYEEIRFDNSTEQSLFMLARALNHDPPPDLEVHRVARRMFAQAVDRGVYATKTDPVVDIAPCLYPLHPAAIATVAFAARRFGQNERSLFSFLHSLEPDGFQRFIRSTPYDADNWYRTPNVLDHLAATMPDNPTNGRQRRWSLAIDALSVATDLGPCHRDALKTVALLSVLEPVPGLVADAQTIAWCLDLTVAQVFPTLEELCTRRLIYLRTHRDDYSLWSNTSVDLSQWLDNARRDVDPPKHLQDIPAVPRVGRPVVAHRHYHATGTFRAFDVLLWTGVLPQQSARDGRILVVPHHPDQARDDQLLALGDAFRDPLTLVCLRHVPNSALQWAHELALWDWVRHNCPELRVDELARTEVSERIAAAETALLGVTSLLASPSTSDADSWWAGGQPINVCADTLSAVVSDVCDDVYDQTPVLRNELLNRHKLTSAAATARMRLLEAMLSHATEERLEIEGTPPELAMYLSLLESSGIHRADSDGVYAFHPPTDTRWQPAWSRLDARLAEGGAVPFDTLIAELAMPPLGIHAGPALPLIAAYILANSSDVAVLERDTFVPGLSLAHFMRLTKTPRNFSLRSLREPTAYPSLLPTLSKGLRVIGKCEANVPAITAALYHWFNRLTPYALHTDEVSPTAVAVRDQLRRATDPADLFFHHLLNACLHPDSAGTRTRLDYASLVPVLDAALQELDQAIHHLRIRAVEIVVRAFETADFASLRDALRRDVTPHRHHLHDHRLAVFVDRATRQDAAAAVWLDGVAGHVLGKRPANWTDRTIHEFDLQVRIFASNLAKWLALAQTAQGSGTRLRSVHVVGIDGNDRMLVLREQADCQALRSRIDAVRDLLDDDPDAPQILGRLLEEYIDDHTTEPSDTESQR